MITATKRESAMSFDSALLCVTRSHESRRDREHGHDLNNLRGTVCVLRQ